MQKELEKEQKNTTEANKNDKKKGDNKEKSEEKKEEKVKDMVVELNNIEYRIVRLTPNSSDLGSAIITKDGEKMCIRDSYCGAYSRAS